MADKNMKAKINVEFEESASRQQLNSGEDITTLFGKLKKFLTDLKAVAFSGAYSDLSGVPNLNSYALKAELNTKAEKALYGDSTINVGRLSGSTVGERSTAEGSGTTASGNYSHAEGAGSAATGHSSHAEGTATYANGDNSHAEGNSSHANGGYSHAGGYGSYANGHYSFAHGLGVYVNNYYETAFGKYNNSKDTIFSVGDGLSDSARHNAFEITTTGGKLHDKDIAAKDDIPTSLPANGGNSDTVNNKNVGMSILTSLDNLGVSYADTADTIWNAIPDSTIFCRMAADFTDNSWNFPSGYASQGTLLIIKLSKNRLGGMYLYPKTGGNIFWANVNSDGSYSGNWKKIQNEIKAVTITASTDASGLITLPNNSTREYISVIPSNCIALPFDSSSGARRFIAVDSNLVKQVSTSITFTAYYYDK